MPDSDARESSNFMPSDQTWRALDHGVGTLRIKGELKGYLASVVGEMRFPTRGAWPWFVVVRIDGTKEPPSEDYGPQWPMVRELEAGWLEHREPASTNTAASRRRPLARARGAVRRFDFAWLPTVEAEEKWRELGLSDSDL